MIGKLVKYKRIWILSSICFLSIIGLIIGILVNQNTKDTDGFKENIQTEQDEDKDLGADEVLKEEDNVAKSEKESSNNSNAESKLHVVEDGSEGVEDSTSVPGNWDEETPVQNNNPSLDKENGVSDNKETDEDIIQDEKSWGEIF